MSVMINQTKLDIKPLVEYFKPLVDYLKEQVGQQNDEWFPDCPSESFYKKLNGSSAICRPLTFYYIIVVVFTYILSKTL